MTTLTAEDLAFLARPLHGFFTVAGGHDLISRLAARYWDLDDPTRSDDLAAMLADDWVRVVLHTETVHRYAY